MKKFLIILAIGFLPFFSSAQFVTLTDVNFANWLFYNFPGAMNGMQLDTTNYSITGTTSLFISGYGLSFTNLDGIQYFDACEDLYCGAVNLTGLANLPPQLKTLDVSNNFIGSLPSLPNTLQSLTVAICGLTSLPILPNSLETIYCSSNNISALPPLPMSLKILNCRNNALTALPVLPSSLEELYCENNQLTVLPSLPSGFRKLSCENNQLTGLPILPPLTNYLNCSYNQIDSLPALPNTLVTLYCRYNLLSSLPTLSNSLASLQCGNNPLGSLPNLLSSNLFYISCNNIQLSNLPPLPVSLIEFYCNDNQITNLPLIPPLLKKLYCQNNLLTSLPAFPSTLEYFNCENNQLHCLPHFPNSLKYLKYLSGNSINCLPNYPVLTLSNSDSLIALCNINSSCPIYPNIGGKTYFDTTGNSVYTSGEPLINLFPLRIQPGSILTGTHNGIWGYAIDTAVTYTIEGVFSIPYYTIVPDTYMLAVPTFFDVDTNLNFGLQALGTFIDLSIDLIASVSARPGFSFSIRLQYLNPGTVMQNPTIDLLFNATELTFDFASLNPVSQSAGMLSFTPGNIDALQNKYIDVQFSVNPSTLIGTILNFNATVSPLALDQTPSNNVDFLNELVIGSFDPNDKLVSMEDLLLLQVLNQEWLEYTIRFQNTGTANAINVRLEDSLSTYLDWNSFEYMSASHTNQWFLQNGKLIVRYDNIQLPDSGSNLEASTGYFKYRIQVNSNLIVGDQIENFADIYFDFNTPVRTNTAITEVALPTNISVNNRIKINLYPNPVHNELHVNWSSEVNLQELIITDVTGRVVFEESIFTNQYSCKLSTVDFTKGIYFIHMYNSDVKGVAKFVKI